MQNEMIERCAWALVQSLHWNVEGGKPLAWSDLDPNQEKLIKNSVTEVIKELSTITDVEAKKLIAIDDNHTISTNCNTCGGHVEGMQNILKAILNAK